MSDEITNEQLDHLAALADAATPGKRTVDGQTVSNEYGAGRLVPGHEWDGFDATVGDGHMVHDPAFLAATDPDTIRALIADLRTARTERDKAVEEYERSRVTVTITDPPPSERMVPVLMPCPRCGLR